MRKLLIQWKHLSVEGKTCQRCSDTGNNIIEVLEALKSDPLFKELDFNFEEVKLPLEKIGQSNEVLLNGVPLENFLPGATVGENKCRSCTDLVGNPVNCRTICRGEDTLESVPKVTIRQVILNWFDLNK